MTPTRLLAGATAGLMTISLAGVLAPPAAANAARLDGVWRTDGYGQYLRFDGARLRRFDVTASSCLPAGVGHASRTRAGATRYEFEDDDAVTVRPTSPWSARARLDSATSIRLLHRVRSLPTRCTRPAPTDPRAVFDTFWETFDENYPFFAEQGVDWEALRDRYRPGITAATTSGELFAVLGAMLRGLRDAHVALLGPNGRIVSHVRPGTVAPTPALDAAVRHLVRDVDLPSTGTPAGALSDYANGRLSFAELPGHVGYLRVTGFTGYADADTEPANRAELDRVLDTIFRARAVHRWRGMLVDLRVNGGGSDALAVQLARRLGTRTHVAYAKQYLDSSHRWSAPQPSVVRPSAAAFGGPLALLTSGSTVSAGETFVQAMLARTPAPLRVGETTQGVFADTLDRVLPNGWQVVLPNERYLTPRGESFDLRGIPATLHRRFVTAGTVDPLFADAYRAVRARG